MCAGTNVIPGIWSNIEASVGVVCACLPAMGPLLLRLKRQASNPSSTPFGNERNGTAPSTLRGEGFQRMDEIDSAASRKGRPVAADVQAFVHASPTLPSDDYEMGAIRVTKSMNQNSASKDRLISRLESDTALFSHIV